MAPGKETSDPDPYEKGLPLRLGYMEVTPWARKWGISPSMTRKLPLAVILHQAADKLLHEAGKPYLRALGCVRTRVGNSRSLHYATLRLMG